MSIRALSFLIACTAVIILQELHRYNAVPWHQNKPTGFIATYKLNIVLNVLIQRLHKNKRTIRFQGYAGE